MRVLIIDDDAELTAVMKRGLEADRLSVDIVAKGQTGFEYSETSGYDLIVLDPNVVDSKSENILRRIRSNDSHVPVVVIAANCSVDEKVRYFELSADDYLVKPFSFAELRVRVHAVLRRAPKATLNSITIGGLALDQSNQRAILDTRVIDLTEAIPIVGISHGESKSCCVSAEPFGKCLG